MRKIILICVLLTGCVAQPAIPDDDPYPYVQGDMALIEIQGVI